MATGSPNSANGHGGASERRKGGAADCDASDTATVRGEVPQLVEQRVGGRALAAIRFHHEGGRVIPARPVQGILSHLLLRTHFGCGPRGGRGTLNVHVSATVSHGSVRQ